MKTQILLKSIFGAVVLVASAGLLFTSCGSVNASIRLRPDLSDDDTEIWQIDARGDAFTSYEEVEEAMKKKATEKSEIEGYDCFFIYSDSYKTERSSFSTTTIKTMQGRANSYGSANYTSDHYNNMGSYLGSSQGKVNTNSNTYYSYDVPVTETYNVSKPTAVWYVFFKEEDECKKLRKSKLRENLYYNRDYLDKRFYKNYSDE